MELDDHRIAVADMTPLTFLDWRSAIRQCTAHAQQTLVWRTRPGVSMNEAWRNRCGGDDFLDKWAAIRHCITRLRMLMQHLRLDTHARHALVWRQRWGFTMNDAWCNRCGDKVACDQKEMTRRPLLGHGREWRTRRGYSGAANQTPASCLRIV